MKFRLLLGLLIGCLALGAGFILFSGETGKVARDPSSHEPLTHATKRTERSKKPGSAIPGRNDGTDLSPLLARDPIEVVRGMRSSDHKDNRTKAGELAIALQRAISVARNYDVVISFLSVMSTAEQEHFLRIILASRSPGGEEFDFREKSRVLEALSLGRDGAMWEVLLESSANSDILPLIRSSKDLKVTDGDLRTILRSAVSIHGVDYSGEVLLSIPDEGLQETLIPQMVPYMLAADSKRAGKFVETLPRGKTKQLAIREVATWLRSKGDAEGARPWEDLLD